MGDVDRGLEQRMQRFAAVGIIKADGQFLVNVFAAFDSEEDCENYITNTVATTLRDL